jgi:hypothetical protein
MTISPTTREETHGLQGGFDLPYQALDVGGGDGPLGAGDANATDELVTIELFAGPILLDEQRCCQDGSLVSAEALLTILTLPPAAHAAA